MKRQILHKVMIQIIACLCVQLLLMPIDIASCSNQIACLSPVLNLDSLAIQQSFVSQADSADRLIAELQSSAVEIYQASEIISAKSLLADLEQVVKRPDSVALPIIEVMSDFHGEINSFLKYIEDIILQKTNIKVTLDHTKFPEQSLKEQLAVQGFDWEMLKSKKVKFHLLGDFSDRGRYGIKCSMVAQELKAAGIAEIVLGNHDLLQLMASMGYHLPIHKGYDLYGHVESEKLVFEEHWDDPEIARDRLGWWSVKMVEFVKQRKAMQQGSFSVNGIEDIKDVREELKTLYLGIQDQFDVDEKELWEDLIGFFFGATDVATGFNDIGMMSVKWWQERADRVDECLEQSRKKFKFKGLSPREFNHEIVVWENLKNYVDQALTMVETELKIAKKQGKWWHQVFNDINHQTYSSPEWYALDWIFHKLWGTSLIAELNELEIDKNIVWDETNFMKNKHVLACAAFFRNNFLYLRDEYGFYYAHALLPIDRLGHMGFTYKGVVYQDKAIWQGLDVIQADVRNKDNSFAELSEAFSLIMSWYADKTVQVKPQHIKEYIEKFGIELILQRIGAFVLFTGHNPLNALALKGVGFKEQQGDYVYISVDKGMSWKKFKDVGGYVDVDCMIKSRGFKDVEFDEIIDNPPTMTLKQKNEKWTSINIQENKPLERLDFLKIAIKQVKAKLTDLEKESSVNSKAGIVFPLIPVNSLLSEFVLIQQAV